jgi:hypothetical protein
MAQLGLVGLARGTAHDGGTTGNVRKARRAARDASPQGTAGWFGDSGERHRETIERILEAREAADRQQAREQPTRQRDETRLLRAVEFVEKWVNEGGSKFWADVPAWARTELEAENERFLLELTEQTEDSLLALHIRSSKARALFKVNLPDTVGFALLRGPNYPNIMDEAAKACKLAADYYGLPVELVTETLAELRAKAARETTTRATATPRPESAAIAQQVFAEAAAKSSRRYQRHVFTENELRDPETINRARDTLADIEAARRVGAQISNEQRLAGRWAKAFIRKAQQRGPA